MGWLLAGIASYQTGASMAKGLFPVFGAVGTVGLRIGFAAALMLLIFRPWRSVRLSPALWRLVLIYGGSMGLMNLVFYLAIARVPLGVAVSLEFLGPLALALAGSRSVLDILWFLLILGGLACLLYPGHGVPHLDPIGVAFALCGGALWAVYLISGTRIGNRISPAQTTTLGMAVGALVLSPCVVMAVPHAVADPKSGAIALGVAVLSSAVPYVLDMMAMARLTARDMGILYSLDPAYAGLAGLVLLGEALAPAQWLGMGLVVLASLGNVLISPKKRPPPIEIVAPPEP